jgi:hypothetical protein
MRNFKSPFFLSVLYILLNAGCKKSETQQFTAGYNVYMAGTVNGNAVSWKNGQATELAQASNATCVAVSGADVYVGGQSNYQAVYWKDGQLILLGQGSSNVNGIAISGSNVYCSGQAAGNLFIDSAGGSLVNTNSAVYWGNGILTSLEPNSRFSAAEGICFAGPDMYVVGHAYNNFDTAVQWKNGIRSDYTDNNAQTSIAYAVATSGTDVYAAGVFNGLPVYWKNGIMTMLNSSGSGSLINGYASAITIVGTDIYIAGPCTLQNTGLTAAYWKNGVITSLSTGVSGSSFATGIAVAGTDVYVVGATIPASGPGSSPAYWKNGIEVNLSGSGTINAVCVGN